MKASKPDHENVNLFERSELLSWSAWRRHYRPYETIWARASGLPATWLTGQTHWLEAGTKIESPLWRYRRELANYRKIRRSGVYPSTVDTALRNMAWKRSPGALRLKRTWLTSAAASSFMVEKVCERIYQIAKYQRWLFVQSDSKTYRNKD